MTRQPRPAPFDGALVIDKPAGRTSHDVVEAARRLLGFRQIGHLGTLDPIATGVLPICLGEATKLAGYLIADDKEYEADLVFGVDTDTLDRTGTVVATRPADHVTRDALLAALAARTGEQDQLPPIFSAIKQGGVRMYKRARAGEEIERTPRRVRIDRLELLDFQPPHARILIACSKGTYVRSIVADLGSDLGAGAHMTELRRTRSGAFTLDQACDLDHMDSVRLVPMEQATRLPVIVSPAELVPRIRSGLQLPPEMFSVPPEIYERFQIFDEHSKLVAVAHVEDHRVHYDRVFAP